VIPVQRTINFIARKLGCSASKMSLGWYYYLMTEGDTFFTNDSYVATKGEKGKVVVSQHKSIMERISKAFPNERLKLHKAYVLSGGQYGLVLSGDFSPDIVYILDNKREEKLEKEKKLILKEC
jgi:hypothetical protein